MRMNYGVMVMDEINGDAGGGAGGGGAGDPGAGAGANVLTPAASAPGGNVLNTGNPNPTPNANPAPNNTGTPAPVTIPENWKDALPDEIKNDPSMKPYHNFVDVTKSLIHLNKMIGRPNVPIPDWKLTSESDRQAFFQKIGLPAKQEEYAIEVPKGSKFADGFITGLKEVGYKAGILPHQMNEFVKWYDQANTKALNDFVAQDRAEVVKQVQALKTEWGQDFERNSKLANGALHAALASAGLNQDEVKSWLESGAGNDPMLIKILFKLSGFLKEDVIGDGGGEIPAAVGDVKEEINSILGDPKHPANDKHHPNHNAAIQHLQGLFQKIHPAKKDMQPPNLM